MTKRLLFAVARARATKTREPQKPVNALLVYRNDQLAGTVQMHTVRHDAFRASYTWVLGATVYPDLGSAIEGIVRVDQTFRDPVPVVEVGESGAVKGENP